MNDKWIESGFMLIQQVAHLAKYQTLKEMESCGLKPNQAGILVVLRSEGGLSQKELAKRMGVTPPSMTAALKKMRENVLRYKEFQGMDMCEIMEKTRPPKMPEKSI